MMMMMSVRGGSWIFGGSSVIRHVDLPAGQASTAMRRIQFGSPVVKIQKTFHFFKTLFHDNVVQTFGTFLSIREQ